MNFELKQKKHNKLFDTGFASVLFLSYTRSILHSRVVLMLSWSETPPPSLRMSAPAQASLAIFRKSGGSREIAPSNQLRVLGVISPSRYKRHFGHMVCAGCWVSHFQRHPDVQNFQKFQEEGTQLYPFKCKKGRISRFNCKDELCPLLGKPTCVALAPLY
jgi:hypothetical protein